MPLNSFLPTLNDYCRKYLVVGHQPPTAIDVNLAQAEARELNAALFEQFLLFDTISIKVFGENIPLCILLRLLGERGLEEIIEQGAIRFVLWTPSVTHLVSDVSGVNALQYGNLNSPAHSDPEQSLELGLKWLPVPPTKRLRKWLRKKVLPLYYIPASTMSRDAVEFANAAFASGKLKRVGLDPEKITLMTMSAPQRSLLCKCATDLLEYQYLMSGRLTAFSNYESFQYLSDSIRRLKTADQITSQFNELARMESFPDLRSLFPTLRNGYGQLPKLRQRRSAREFRQWFATATQGDEKIATEYLEALTSAAGPLSTPQGKLLKAIGMAGAGAVVGSMIDGPLLALAAGGAAAAIGDRLVDLGLDILDEFLLDGLRKGWHPRLFFDDLRALEHPDLRVTSNAQT